MKIKNALMLKKNIVESGYTPAKLAKELNLSTSTLNQCLRRKAISPKLAKCLTQKLNLNFDIFFEI